jgi:hypothetical protein
LKKELKMGKIRIFVLIQVLLVILLTFAATTIANAGVNWNSHIAGNPLLPGYFADPCVRKFGDTYYIYATPDGWDVGKGPFVIWTSKDFVHWTSHKSNWPTTDFKWAPSVVKKNNKYYMYTQTPCMVWGAVSDTPLGPWTSLSPPGQPMIPDQTPKGTIVLDGECFIDTDGQNYIWYGTWWTPTMAKLNDDMCTISGTPIQYFKNPNNPNPPYGVVQGCMEAPYMFKHNGTYYLMYSNMFCQDSSYRVEYSTATTPYGPFTYGKNNPILETNDDDTVDGPGHHSILEDNGKIYIVYHRHDNPHSPDGAHRQVAADELYINPDGSIEKVVPSHGGVGYLAPSTVRDTNLAVGKKATASSFAGPDFIPDYAADENNGTIWKAAGYIYPQWLQIDLGKPQQVKRVETEFQFAQVAYRYIIEYSNNGKTWKTFADRKNNKDWGPMIDHGYAKARYFRITILGDDSPQRPSPEIGIWNFKLYDGIKKPNRAPSVDCGPNIKRSIKFPTIVLNAAVTDDGLPNGPVTVRWSKASGPGTVTFEHPNRTYTKASFKTVGKYVLKLSAYDGKLTGYDTITVEMLPPNDQLICYKFDEKSGTIAQDSTINGQNGIISIGTARCLGVRGGAINMNGNNSINVPPLGATKNLTIAAWLNIHTLNADRNSIVCTKGDNKKLQVTITKTGEIALTINGKDVALSSPMFTQDNIGRWEHVAIVYNTNAKTVSFYFDGKQKNTKILDDVAAIDLSEGLNIGGSASGTRGLDGELDEFRLYNKALSPAEILEISTPVKFTSIGNAKKLPNGSAIILIAKPVTFAPKDALTGNRTTNYFYVSERDGSVGIKIQDGNIGHDTATEDNCVSFSGIIKTSETGEKYIELTSQVSNGAPYSIKPKPLTTNPIAQIGQLVKSTGDIVKVNDNGNKLTLKSPEGILDVIIAKGADVQKVSTGNTVEAIGVITTEGKNDYALLAKEIKRLNPPPSPMLVHYTFDNDNDSIAKDSSGNGYDAQLVNNPKFVPGIIGNAISFDGKKSYLQLPDLGLQKAITIAVWINMNSMGTDDWSTSIIHSDTWQPGDLHLQIPVKSGIVGAAMGGIVPGSIESKFSFNNNLGRWVHVAFAYDSKMKTAALYINGKLEASATCAETKPINLSHSKVGTWGGGSRFFDGKMDDFRIYDHALSEEEIAKLVNQGRNQ